MNLVLKLAFAFLFGAACCYGELSFNCSDKKIFLSEEFSLYYDTINPLHEVMLQRSLHKLRSAIGERATVSRLAPRDPMKPELEPEAGLLDRIEETENGIFPKLNRRIKKLGNKIRPPKPKPVTTKHVTMPHHETTVPHHETTKQHDTTKQHGTTKQHTTISEPTTPHSPVPASTTTPRPAPVVTTTTQFIPDTTTTPEGRRTTESTTTTPEGRRTTESTTTTPEGRRTTEPVPDTTTTPEQRRTTSTQTTTPERRRTTAALPVVLDLELEVDMGRGVSLLVTINGRGREDRRFELVIDAPITQLTADSLPGAIQGLEVMGQLMQTNQNGDKFLPACTVY